MSLNNEPSVLKAVRKNVDAGSYASSVNESYVAMKDAFSTSATQFNLIREMLSSVYKMADEMKHSYASVNKSLDRIYGCDIRAIVIEEKDVPDTVVENEESFVNALENAIKDKDPFSRMDSLISLNKAIIERIGSWNEKIVKMQERKGLDKGTEESRIADEKIIKFEIVIEALKKRAESVSKMFSRTSDQVVKSLTLRKSKFTPMFQQVKSK